MGDIRLPRGFAYLVAIIDWYSRRVLSWRISNSMEAVFCVDCLEDALRHHGKPEIFNSDLGSQFTSVVFTEVQKREGVVISVDGRGAGLRRHLRRAGLVQRQARGGASEGLRLDGELMVDLTEHVVFCNGERPHQSLENKTPDTVYRSAIDGGAMVVDKFGCAEENTLCSATLHKRFLLRRSNILIKGKSGAAPSCYVKSNVQLNPSAFLP